MYQQVYDPVADSLGLTSLLAAIPLTLMFCHVGSVQAFACRRLYP
jgi:hypothetical protein